MYRNCNWNWYWNWNNTFSVYFYILFFYSKTKQDIAKCFGVELVEHTETRSKKNKKIKFWILDFGFWILNFGFWIFWKRQNQKTKKNWSMSQYSISQKKVLGGFLTFFGGGTPPEKVQNSPKITPKIPNPKQGVKYELESILYFAIFFLFLYIFFYFFLFFLLF